MTAKVVDADDLMRICSLHDELRNLINHDQFNEVEELLLSRRDLVTRNWKAMLETCGLAHDFISMHMCLRLIIHDMDDAHRYEVYSFLKNLDRVIELSGMFQIPSILRVSSNEKDFVKELENFQATRVQLFYHMNERMRVCAIPTYRNVTSHIGDH